MGDLIILICHMSSCDLVFKGHLTFWLGALHHQPALKVSQHSAKVGDSSHCDSGDTMFLFVT